LIVEKYINYRPKKNIAKHISPPSSTSSHHIVGYYEQYTFTFLHGKSLIGDNKVTCRHGSYQS